MTPEVKKRIDQIRRGIVPEGYKKGKLGIVPGEWDEIPFSTLFTSTSDYTDNLHQYPLYSLTIEDGITAKTERYERSHLVKKDNSYKVVRPNDYAYNPMNIRFGAVARHKGDIPVAVSGYYDVFTTVHKSDLVFMDSFLTCGPMITYYNKVSTGSLIEKQRVHFSDFLEFSLALPPLEERKKIAKILTTQDKAIELERQRIDEILKVKQFFLGKMFPKKGQAVPEIRFKGFTGVWEQRKFGEVFDCTVPNNTLSRAELSYDEGTVLNVHYGDVLIKYDSVLDVQKDDIPRIPHRCREDFNGALLQDGDVIIADTAEDETTGKACEIGNLQGSAIVSGLHTMVCRPRNRMALGYLGYYLNSNAYHHQLLPLMQGIKVLSLSRSNIQKTSVSYPSAMKEQQLIASYFSQLDHLITLHQRKLEEEKKKKKALMQLLLTGIVRV